MTDFETALDDCLARLEAGQDTLEACLARYPQFAQELRPLLATVAFVGRNAGSPPTPEFRAQARKRLENHARAHPHRRSPALFAVRIFRAAGVTAALLVALLLTGTVFVQAAYPGDALYGWKLASENLVRPFSPIRVDMWLSQRRADEVLAVRTEPARLAIALEQYRLVMERLLAYDDPQFTDEILLLLQRQANEFARLGIPVPGESGPAPLLPTLTPTPPATDALETLIPGVTLLSPLPTSTPSAEGIPAPTRTPLAFPTLRPPPPLPTLPPLPTPVFPPPCQLPICP